MLKKELNNQKKNWTAIVPDKCYGFLPKLTNYKVILKNNRIKVNLKEEEQNLKTALENGAPYYVYAKYFLNTADTTVRLD